MVYELPEVGVGRRDGGVTSATGLHGATEVDEVVACPAPFGQQVGRIVLKPRKQKPEVSGIDRLSHHGESQRVRRAELGYGGIASPSELLEGQDPSVG